MCGPPAVSYLRLSWPSSSGILTEEHLWQTGYEKLRKVTW
jgi:hypothetical protein